MKRLILLLLSVIYLVACGANSQSTSQTESESNNQGNEANVPAGDVITLVSSIQAPQGSDLSNGFDAYLDKVEEISNNAVEFERYYGETLIKAADHLEAVGSGVADIALLVPSYTPAQNKLANIESLPALWENQWAGTMAYMDLFKEFPEFKQEFADVGVEVVNSWVLPSYYVISSKDISNFEDLKGNSLVTAGGLSLLADELGANSVGIVITEAFEAMEKGTVDGALLGLTGASTYGIHEVTKSVWMLPVGSQGGVVGVNQSSYDTLPDEIKDAFEKASLENAVDFHEIYQVNAEEAALEKFKEAGATINEASDEDITELRDIVSETIWNDWKEDPSREQYDTDEILDRFIELIDKYEKEFNENGLPK